MSYKYCSFRQIFSLVSTSSKYSGYIKAAPMIWVHMPENHRTVSSNRWDILPPLASPENLSRYDNPNWVERAIGRPCISANTMVEANWDLNQHFSLSLLWEARGASRTSSEPTMSSRPSLSMLTITPHPHRHRHTCLRTSQNVPSNLRSKSPSISSLASSTKTSRASQYDCISLLTAKDPCHLQLKCLCTSSTYITGYHNCVHEYCDAADISSWVAYADSQCAGMPLTIWGSIGLGTVLTRDLVFYCLFFVRFLLSNLRQFM